MYTNNFPDQFVYKMIQLTPLLQGQPRNNYHVSNVLYYQTINKVYYILSIKEFFYKK